MNLLPIMSFLIANNGVSAAVVELFAFAEAKEGVTIFSITALPLM